MGMSHFAGLYSLEPGVAPPFRLSDALAAGLRSFGGTISTYSDQRLVLHHGHYLPGRAAGWTGAGKVAALAGSLILDGGQPELDALSSEDALSIISRANGTFALAQFEPESARLVLATDSLGARPLYWSRQGGVLIFSTAIRLIASLPGLRFEVDWPAVAEQGAFCYPLATRTSLIGVQVLRDGEVLTATPASVEVSRYHRWEETPQVEASAGQHADHLHQVFMEAVKDRCPAAGPVTSLLSGGLDSRCIAAALLDLGRTVEVWNLACAGWQDDVFAVQFAARAGLKLNRVQWTRDALAETPGLTTMGALRAATSKIEAPVTFSGDGGGETIGFLMNYESIMSLLREGRVEEAIRKYVKEVPVSKRVLGSALHRKIKDAPIEGMASEFAAMPGIAPQKALQLFLLRNDLRRHLHDYFEFSERHHTELLLPFYDRRVLEGAIRISPPLDRFLAHRLYYEWMKRFQAPVLDTPWQSYEGHEPCPLPIPPRVTAQKEALEPHRMLRGKDWMRLVLAEVWHEPLPHPTLRGLKPAMLLTALQSLVSLKDASYHFREYLWVTGLCRLALGQPYTRA
jgi:asparagine synthase (glutamine-hydrolysing)